ncbi:serpentine type 7TM GPCR chemoreceptor str domain-containing protein [Ditylenchus destructor]|uniref:Serpentine type 7TM GPCR chemoreceptor str domain-containing protein n=1 Tax=Ditylenchus destructor TaxID=166010 RepID=A0AAD4MEE4_9BILA|nr:serpentine type 7TM GPCR chemoreceptor str domain-containing protein [Ditylenchus destructor]
MPNSTFYEFYLPSDEVVIVLSIMAVTNLLALLVSYGLLMYVCLKKSPAAMSGYKWLILVNATCSVAYEALFLTLPEFLFPNPMIALANPLLSNVILSDTFMYFYGDVLVASMVVTIITNMIMFPYRYCQTTRNWIYRNVFSNTKVAISLAIVLLILECASTVAPIHGLYMPRDQIMEAVLETNPSFYGFIKSHNVLGALVCFMVCQKNSQWIFTYSTAFDLDVDSEFEVI